LYRSCEAYGDHSALWLPLQWWKPFREATVSYSVYRIVLAVVAAAIVACFFTIITATADQVEASAPIIGAQCSQQAWPYFEAHCLRDRRQSDARPARVVTTERW
jgi:hypothetical protein